MRLTSTPGAPSSPSTTAPRVIRFLLRASIPGRVCWRRSSAGYALPRPRRPSFEIASHIASTLDIAHASDTESGDLSAWRHLRGRARTYVVLTARYDGVGRLEARVTRERCDHFGRELRCQPGKPAKSVRRQFRDRLRHQFGRQHVGVEELLAPSSGKFIANHSGPVREVQRAFEHLGRLSRVGSAFENLNNVTRSNQSTADKGTKNIIRHMVPKPRLPVILDRQVDVDSGIQQDGYNPCMVAIRSNLQGSDDHRGVLLALQESQHRLSATSRRGLSERK